MLPMMHSPYLKASRNQVGVCAPATVSITCHRSQSFITKCYPLHEPMLIYYIPEIENRVAQSVYHLSPMNFARNRGKPTHAGGTHLIWPVRSHRMFP